LQRLVLYLREAAAHFSYTGAGPGGRMGKTQTENFMLLSTARPSADLVPWVHSFRLSVFFASDPAHLCLFPGTGAEIWFVLSGVLAESSRRLSGGLLCLRSVQLGLCQSGLRLFSIRLRAGALPFFSQQDLPCWIDRFSPLTALWDGGGQRLADRITGCDDFNEQCRLAEQGLRTRLLAGRKLEAMQQLAASIYEDCAGFSLSDYADRQDCHRSSLSHFFHETQGVSAKYFHRLCRFERFLREALYSPGASLAGLAVAHGYYDQAHMHRDVRELTLSTPAALLQQSSTRLFYLPRH